MALGRDVHRAAQHILSRPDMSGFLSLYADRRRPFWSRFAAANFRLGNMYLHGLLAILEGRGCVPRALMLDGAIVDLPPDLQKSSHLQDALRTCSEELGVEAVLKPWESRRDATFWAELPDLCKLQSGHTRLTGRWRCLDDSVRLLHAAANSELPMRDCPNEESPYPSLCFARAATAFHSGALLAAKSA